MSTSLLWVGQTNAVHAALQAVHPSLGVAATIPEGLQAAPDALILSMCEGEDAGIDTDAGFALVEALRGDKKPRYVVGVYPQDGGVRGAVIAAAAGSLSRYLNAHLLLEDVRINLVAYCNTSLGHVRAARTVAALVSGRLDSVCGETFVLTDN